MPRIHHVKAGKDYPAHGIKKGEMYYHWSFFRGPKQMSKTAPRRSQTTASPNLSAAYAAEEDLHDALLGTASPEDLVSVVRDAVTAAEEVIDQYDETISNLEQAFAGGCPALEEAQEKREAVETWKEELDAIATEIDGVDIDEWNEQSKAQDFEGLTDEEKSSMMDELRGQVEAIDLEA